jgi:hypothetical protein
MKINYTFIGKPIPDFSVERFLYDNLDNKAMLEVSTENVIHRARAFVHDKIIDEIEVYFHGVFVGRTDSSGRLERWPDGFCDFMDDSLMRLLDN